MHRNYNNHIQSHSHRERQSINRCESDAFTASASATASPSPAWIKDLLVKKRGKLVDIVCNGNAVKGLNIGKTEKTEKSEKCWKFANSSAKSAKPELTSTELNISGVSCVSSKSGKTSIGSNTSPPESVGTGALSDCCQSGLSCQNSSLCLCQPDVPFHWESGFNTNAKNAKAVHLHSASSVNVPIARSVSSSLPTGRPCSRCSRCLVSTCVDCLDHLRSVSICDSNPNDSSNKSNHFNTNTHSKCCCISKVCDLSSQQITPGLVAQRKIQILRRQVSDSSSATHSWICSLCGDTSYETNNDIYCNHLIKDKMINEKVRDNTSKSEYLDNEANHHHYEVIMDYNKTNSVNGFDKHSKTGNGIEVDVDNNHRDDNEFELQYGPGIVDRLKLKFLSISIQQQSSLKLKRCSSLENIAVSNDSRLYQSQHSIPSYQYLSCAKPPLQANDLLLPLLGKNGSINVKNGSIPDAGNKANGTQLSHRLYIQRHNCKNIYNSKSSAIVPLIKRAKSMETLLFQDDRGRQPLNCTSNQLNDLQSATETPLYNQNDLQLLNDNKKLISDSNSTNESTKSGNRVVRQSNPNSNPDMKSVSNLNARVNDELPKPDTVKTYKRIFEPIHTKTGEDIGKTVPNGITSNNINNKSKNNYKKSQPNSASNANVKRKPPVLRATNKNASVKCQPSVNSLPTIKSQSSSPPVIHSISTPTNRMAVNNKPIVGELVNNDNNNNSTKSANNSNTTNPSMKKPPIAPKRASLTLRSNPLTGMSAPAINKNMKLNGFISANSANASNRHNCNNNHNIHNSSLSADQKMPEKSSKTKPIDALTVKNIPQTPVVPNGQIQPKESSAVVPNSRPIVATSNGLDTSDSPTNKAKVNKPIANIKPFTQCKDDVKSETLKVCQSVNGEHIDSDLGHDRTNGMSIGGKAGKACLQITDNNNVITNNKSNKNDNEVNETVFESFESSLISTLNSDSNRTQESNECKTSGANDVNDENVSPNSCDIMVNKTNSTNNRIEDQSSLTSLSAQTTQTTDVLKSSLLLNTENNNNSNNSSKPATSSLWSQQTNKSTNSSTTTIVFDFRGKDVKSNLALHPAPFGVTTPKRSTKNGSISSNGSLNDSDDDDNYSGSTDMPLPSGILFLGENIVVGKGSMLLKRNKKLTIQFNDLATKTFEYPSESSLLAELGITGLEMSADVVNQQIKSESNNANNSVIGSESSNSITGLTALKTNLALGGSSGGLGSYKPTLIDTSFELGVSRTTKTNANPNPDIVSNDVNSSNNSDDLELVKPADPDQTTSWSTSSTASDLLF